MARVDQEASHAPEVHSRTRDCEVHIMHTCNERTDVHGELRQRGFFLRHVSAVRGAPFFLRCAFGARLRKSAESRSSSAFFAQMNAERNKEKNVETNERRKRIGQLDLQLTSIVPLRALPHFKYRSLKS